MGVSRHEPSESTEHGFEPVTVHYAVAPGVVLSGGGIFLVTEEADDVQMFYLALSYTGSKMF